MITLTIIIIITLIIYVLPTTNYRIFGRPIWYNPKKIIDLELDGKGTSQQFLDIYSLSHITHGVLFYFLLNFLEIKNNTFVIALLLEIAFEIFENSALVTKYRKNTEFKNYHGDSIVNILGDIIAAAAGFLLARNYPQMSILYVALAELITINKNSNFIHLSIGSLVL